MEVDGTAEKVNKQCLLLRAILTHFSYHFDSFNIIRKWSDRLLIFFSVFQVFAIVRLDEMNGSWEKQKYIYIID